MSPLAGDTVMTIPQLTVEKNAAAYARTHDDAEYHTTFRMLFSCTPGGFGKGKTIRIVGKCDRNL